MGIFKKFGFGLKKTREGMTGRIEDVLGAYEEITDDFYDDLEEALIMGDIGMKTATDIVEELRKRVNHNEVRNPKHAKMIISDIIADMIDGGEDMGLVTVPSIVLVIGVNGVGKTTSIGKIAAGLKAQGKKVILAAADTFRAAAIEQLTEWANRAGVDIIAQNEGSDPGAVVFDALQAAKSRNADVLICDTAGRLHNKKNLMDELKKIDKIISREFPDAHRENLIVLDGTTGQNALSQLREFKEVSDISGIVLTKMDGTAKGGIAVAIQSEYNVPVKYIGVGEKIEDLQKFNSDEFVNALFEINDNKSNEE